jgi:hypothetical protein
MNLKCECPIILTAGAEGESPKIEMDVYTGGLMRAGGFGVVGIDLAGIEHGDSCVICVDHNEDALGVIGHGTVSTDGGKLALSGVVTADTDIARHIVQTGQRGQPWQASVSVDVIDRVKVKEKEVVELNGAKVEGPFLRVTRSRLRESSVVVSGADGKTASRIVAAETRETAMNEEEQSQSDLVAKASEAAITAERGRVSAIEKLCAGWDADYADQVGAIRASAVQGGDSVDVVREKLLEMVRSKRIDVGPGPQPKPEALPADALECALVASSGAKTDSYGDEVQTRAEKFSGLGMRDLFTMAARQLGDSVVTLTSDHVRHVLRASYAGVPSTLDVSGILGNVLRKQLTQAFQEVPNTSKQICGTLSVKDFKSNSIYRPIDGLSLKLIDSSGKIPAGTMGETNYTNQAKTYGRLISVSRQQIVNDDLGVFGSLGADFGRAAGRLHDQLFYTLLATAVSGGFVSGARNNYISGGASALSSAALGNAYEAMLEQTISTSDDDPMGATTRPIDVTPKYLLIPPALFATAKALYVSMETGRDDEAPTANVWQNMFPVIYSAYMSSSSYVNSDTAWVLFADPATGMAAYEFCYLNGNQNPTVEEVDADSDELGIAMRGYFDFGVKKQVPQAAVQSNGV